MKGKRHFKENETESMHETKSLEALPCDLAKVRQREIGLFATFANEFPKLVEILPKELGDDEEVFLVVEEIVHVQHMVLVCVPRRVDVLKELDLI